MKGYTYLTTRLYSLPPDTSRERQGEVKNEAIERIGQEMCALGVTDYRITANRKHFGNLCPVNFWFRIYVAIGEYSTKLRRVANGWPADYDLLDEYLVTEGEQLS